LLSFVTVQQWAVRCNNIIAEITGDRPI